MVERSASGVELPRGRPRRARLVHGGLRCCIGSGVLGVARSLSGAAPLASSCTDATPRASEPSRIEQLAHPAAPAGRRIQPSIWGFPSVSVLLKKMVPRIMNKMIHQMTVMQQKNKLQDMQRIEPSVELHSTGFLQGNDP